ncbi:MAG: hypothetical protein ACMG6E_00335 [Candidatus Roizmanbacteria bacterium]
MPAASISSHKQPKVATLVLGVAVLIVGAVVGYLILTQNGSLDLRNRAQEPNAVNTANPNDVSTANKVIPTTATKTLPTENSSTSPLPSGQICKQDGGKCSWTPADNASGYRYQILDQTSGTTAKEGVTKSLEVSFTPLVNHTYKCIISAINICGEAAPASAVNTCKQDVTPTPQSSPTPGPSATPTLTPTPGPSSTPTVGPSTTPSPTTKPNVTTPIPTQALPKAGFFTPSLLIVGIGAAILAIGFAL